MKLPFSFFCLLLSFNLLAQTSPALEGRWDLAISKDGHEIPSWLEVRHSGHKTLIGRFVYAFGSARPVAEVKWQNGKFSFSLPLQWEVGTRTMDFEGELKGDSLKGSMVFVDGKTYPLRGWRAPSLLREKQPEWGEPVTLFNGKDLSGWHASGTNQWVAENGILKSAKPGSNLITNSVFNDFKLHIEFKYAKNGNSGVYLRGRYEVQITDSKGHTPWDDQFSGIYGFIEPNQMVAKEAGAWQTFDITLVGRTVTVVANGVTVICNAVIPGITGGAINSLEHEPGPLLLQGDHEAIEYRNIIITPAK